MERNYSDFLRSKRLIHPATGFDVAPGDISELLFEFQRDLVRWALKKARAALFATTGMGKTFMQVEWAEKVIIQTGRPVLILAPLGVTGQTVDEAKKLGISMPYARSMAGADLQGITITNYERLDSFDPKAFGGVVLDEGSILKSFSGATKKALVRAFRGTPFKLVATATPSPNEIVELTNYADFLEVMSPRDMLTIFFTTKGVKTGEGRFRLKKHARTAFYQWLASWAMSLTKPSDLGYPDDGFILPPLHILSYFAETDFLPYGQLSMFGGNDLKGVQDRARARRETIEDRVKAAVEMIAREPDERWLIWCGLNSESEALTRAIPGAVEVRGNDKPERKAEVLTQFAHGEIRVLVTKPTIAGFGLNFQGCARMAFVGLNDSYEQYFQALRRCWRFGQTRPVYAYVVLSKAEEVIYENVLRKERETTELMAELVAHVKDFELTEIKGVTGRGDYHPAQPMELPLWLRAGLDELKEVA